MIRWITTLPAWEARALALEAAHQSSEIGRLCMEASCHARSEVGFDLAAGWRLGVCIAHAASFAADCADLIVGQPSRLKADEVLHGPASAQAEAE